MFRAKNALVAAVIVGAKKTQQVIAVIIVRMRIKILVLALSGLVQAVNPMPFQNLHFLKIRIKSKDINADVVVAANKCTARLLVTIVEIARLEIVRINVLNAKDIQLEMIATDCVIGAPEYDGLYHYRNYQAKRIRRTS